MEKITELRAGLANYQANKDYPDEVLAIRCCELACESLAKGCYGIGAILVDRDKNILTEAGNEIFMNGFHSADTPRWWSSTYLKSTTATMATVAV